MNDWFSQIYRCFANLINLLFYMEIVPNVSLGGVFIVVILLIIIFSYFSVNGEK